MAHEHSWELIKVSVGKGHPYLRCMECGLPKRASRDKVSVQTRAHTCPEQPELQLICESCGWRDSRADLIERIVAAVEGERRQDTESGALDYNIGISTAVDAIRRVAAETEGE